MSKRKRSLKGIDSEVGYLLYILREGISKGKEGLEERLRLLEKQMLEKGGVHLIVNTKSGVTHVMENGKALCGVVPTDSYVRVGVSPTCCRCYSLFLSKKKKL